MENRFLKELIANCPLTNFTETGNVNERLSLLDEYLENNIKAIYQNEMQLTKFFWEENFAKNQVTILKNSNYLRRSLLYIDIVVSCFNFISKKYIKDRKASKTAEMLSIQLQNLFRLYTSIMILTINGCFQSVITEYRTLYESYVITKYLVLHPELIPIYKDHSNFIFLHIIRKEYNISPEQEKKYNDFINKYGKDFSDNFGWTKPVIKDSKLRKLITLANEIKLEPFFVPLYKLACNYVHPSSMAATTKIKPDTLKDFFQASLFIIQNEMIDYIDACKVVKKEEVVISNMLYLLYDDIEKDFQNINQII